MDCPMTVQYPLIIYCIYQAIYPTISPIHIHPKPSIPQSDPIHWSNGCPRTIHGHPTQHTIYLTVLTQSTGPMGLSMGIQTNSPSIPQSDPIHRMTFTSQHQNSHKDREQCNCCFCGVHGSTKKHVNKGSDG